MHNDFGIGFGQYGMGASVPFWLLTFVPLFVFWSIFWKGLALWHSAQKGDVWWFIAFLFINTLGILEMVYLFAFLKIKVADLFSSKK